MTRVSCKVSCIASDGETHSEGAVRSTAEVSSKYDTVYVVMTTADG